MLLRLSERTSRRRWFAWLGGAIGAGISVLLGYGIGVGNADPVPPFMKLVTDTGKPVFYPSKAERNKVNAHIVGHFDGWGGNTEFKLDNGQVWRQADSGSTSCPARENPWVKIKPMMLGNWLMYVQDCNESIHVKREQ